MRLRLWLSGIRRGYSIRGISATRLLVAVNGGPWRWALRRDARSRGLSIAGSRLVLFTSVNIDVPS
jgi:hypothetical protein